MPSLGDSSNLGAPSGHMSQEGPGAEALASGLRITWFISGLQLGLHGRITQDFVVVVVVKVLILRIHPNSIRASEERGGVAARTG